MKNNPFLTIKTINTKKSTYKKKVMKLPILSVQSQPCTKKRSKTLQKSQRQKDDLFKERRSLSQMLNIIEYPDSNSKYELKRMTKGKSSVRQQSDRSDHLLRASSHKKYSSLQSEDFRGQLRQAMHMLMKKRRQRLKTTEDGISPLLNKSLRLVNKDWSYPESTERQNLIGNKIKLFNLNDKTKMEPDSTFRSKLLKDNANNVSKRYQKYKRSKQLLNQRIKRKSKIIDVLEGWNQSKTKDRVWNMESLGDQYENLDF